MNLHNKKERVYSDDELSQLQKNHEYSRRKLILDVLSFIFIAALGLISIVFFYYFILDKPLRDSVLTKIADNIVGIVFFSLAMFGIKNKNSL